MEELISIIESRVKAYKEVRGVSKGTGSYIEVRYCNDCIEKLESCLKIIKTKSVTVKNYRKSKEALKHLENRLGPSKM